MKLLAPFLLANIKLVFKSLAKGSFMNFLLQKKNIKIYFAVIFLGGVLVQAAKVRNLNFTPPKNFERETSLFPQFVPTYFTSKDEKKVSLIFPHEISLKEIPKTADNKIHPEFLAGKQNFNKQFGIQEWKIHNFSFQDTKGITKLEMIGSYKNSRGLMNMFIEHYYFSKSKKMQSVQLLYPENANAKSIQEAKASMDSFKPNFE